MARSRNPDRAALQHLLALPLLAAPLMAQQPADQRGRPPTPVVEAVRLRADEAPLIDGDLSDAAWALVPPLTHLRTREPVEDGEPTFETLVRLAQDGRALLIALDCRDAEPSAIRASQRRRDANLDPDDRVELVLDTLHDGSNAYFFQIGAGGCIGDALISSNGDTFNKSWDGLWDGAARITPSGWTAELRIPFATLAVSRDVTTWGFNLKRVVRRLREEVVWATPLQDSSLYRIRDAGELAGLSGLELGSGIDWVPYAKVVASHDHSPLDNDVLGTAGGEAFWKLTPGLTSAFTINTDFAETEVDEHVVSLSRFPTFFPEKRKFFLQDAGVFTFETGGGADGSSDLLPFHSRRIGLDEFGNPIPIEGGVKLSGFEGPWSLGVLAVRTAASGDLAGRELYVARVRRALDDHTTIGAIATSGDPTGDAHNSVVGVDYRWNTSMFQGDRNLAVTAFGLSSSNGDDKGTDEAFGGEVNYPNDLWTMRLRGRQIGADFDPALGFVERTGIRQWDGEVTFGPRPGGDVRQLFFRWLPNDIEDLDGQVATREQRFSAGVEMETGDEGKVYVIPGFDRVDEAFEILPGITVPAGRYGGTRYGASMETAGKRQVVVRAAWETGDFEGGDRTDSSLGFDFLPGGLLVLGADYQINDLSLPGGDFTVHIASLRAELNWSPTVSWQNLLQYDNVSNQFGWNSRLRWTLRAGDDVYLVLNQGYDTENPHALVPERTEVTLKVVRTFRF